MLAQQDILPGSCCPITNCFYEFHSCYRAPSNTSEALRVTLVVPKCVAEEALAQIQPVLGREACPGLSKTACGCFHSGLVGSLSGHLSLLCLKGPREQHNKAVILSEEETLPDSESHWKRFLAQPLRVSYVISHFTCFLLCCPSLLL